MVEYPSSSPFEAKMEAIRRCLEFGESVKPVSEEIDYTRVSVCNWWERYPQEGMVALLNDKNIKLDTLANGSAVPILGLA